MIMRIVINDREITSPVAKFFILFSAMLVAGLITAGVVFVLLPLVGITVVVTLGFIFAVVTASIIGAFVLLLITIIYSLIKGSLHLHVDKRP